ARMGLGLGKHAPGGENAHEIGVLPASAGGGPKGLGDPKDMSLRSVEVNTIIPELMRERLRTESHLCLTAWRLFGACGKRHGGLSFYQCREEIKGIKACHHEKFDSIRDETTELYLMMRAKYRRTGIGHPIRRKEANRDEWFTFEMAEAERRLLNST
ncbi:hypothetical protein BOX15_Mlig020242g1, partial [Macrostomum lignano]